MQPQSQNLSKSLKSGPIRRFFHFCSGATPEILQRPECSTEQIKYSCIGATVFFTGVMASISGGYALYKVFGDQAVHIPSTFANDPFSIPVPVIFGLFWGAMIFNLDRYIVQSIRKEDDIYRQILNALPRIFLAVMLSLVITKPLELKIFEREIESQLARETEQLRKDEENSQETAANSNEISRLTAQSTLLTNEILNKETQRNDFNLIAQQELDGTGGSSEEGAGPIYRAKLSDAAKIETELSELRKRNNALIGLNDKRIADLNKQKSDSISAVVDAKKSADGILGRLSALGKLTQYKADATAFWIELGVIALFMCIETAPVFAKIISKRGSYDAILERLEAEVFAEEKEQLSYFQENAQKESSHKLAMNNESRKAAQENFQNSIQQAQTSPEFATAQSKVHSQTVDRMVNRLSKDLDRHFSGGGLDPNVYEESRQTRINSENRIKQEIRKQIGIRRRISNFVDNAKMKLDKLIGDRRSK